MQAGYFKNAGLEARQQHNRKVAVYLNLPVNFVAEE
jgi:hypothetical protein